MEVKFTISKCPFGDSKRLYSSSTLKIKPGLTPVVGCNGSGKSTLLILLKDQLKDREGARILEYNDRIDGGHNLMERMAINNDMTGVANMFVSSEGERIYRGVGDFVGKIARVVRKEKPKELWCLIDCVGSGLSIDNIVEVKDIISLIQEDNPDIFIYAVLPTNEYEFVRGETCIDAGTLKPVSFNDYEEYREFVMKTRKRKDERGW